MPKSIAYSSASFHKSDSELVIKNLFITNYNVKCFKMLNALDESTKHIIQNNKQLNELYDIFLDFILDSSILLDKDKEQTKE